MSFREIEGNLFEVDLPAIGHGVNCKGVMGAGVAKIFRDKYPYMYRRYQLLCDEGRLYPGDVMPWTATETTILNLATQDNPGADAKLEYIRTAVSAALWYCQLHRISSLGLPRIGAGIGGLDWADVRKVMKEEADKSPVELVVVSLPETKMGETS